LQRTISNDIKPGAASLRALSALLLGLTAVVAAGGCAHHVGYVDVTVSSRPLPGPPAEMQSVTALALVQEPGPESSLVKVRVAKQSIERRPVMLRYRGRAVRIRYHWSAPIVKIFLPLSVPMAFIQPFRQPHCHDSGPWGMADYLRDFAAWLNPFEAYPGGTYCASPFARVFRTRRTVESVMIRQAGLPQALVTLAAEKERESLAAVKTDDDGVASFDLRVLLADRPPGEDMTLRVRCSPEGSALLEHVFTVTGQTRAAWQKRRTPGNP